MESYQVEQNEHDLWAKGTGQQAIRTITRNSRYDVYSR